MDSRSSEVSIRGVVPAVSRLLSEALSEAGGEGLTLATDTEVLNLLMVADGLVSLAQAVRAVVIREAESVTPRLRLLCVRRLNGYGAAMHMRCSVAG